MRITGVRITIPSLKAEANPYFRGYTEIVLTGDIGRIAIHDLRIYEAHAGLDVAFPSRKATNRCGHCGAKVDISDRYCALCGMHLEAARVSLDKRGREHTHFNLIHPLDNDTRDNLVSEILEAYHDARSMRPDADGLIRYEAREEVDATR